MIGAAATALFALCTWQQTATEPACPDGEEVQCEGRPSGGRSVGHFPETTCLEDLSLRGIVRGKNGYRALFESRATIPPKTFVLERGSELFDAKVLEIRSDAVVLRQVPGMPKDQRRCRRVTRVLTTPIRP